MMAAMAMMMMVMMLVMMTALPLPSAALSYMRVGAADTPRQKHALLDTTQASPSVPQAPGVAPPHVPLCQWTSKNHCDHLGQQVAVG